MTNITIPSEAAIALALEIRKHCGIMLSPTTVNAACIAMLRAWPEIKEHAVQVPDDASDDIRYTLKKIGIILPLTESGNE